MKLVSKQNFVLLIRTTQSPWRNPYEISPQTNGKEGLDGNLDPLVIAKQEPWYKEDAAISYGWLIDRSVDESHGNPISSRSSFKTKQKENAH